MEVTVEVEAKQAGPDIGVQEYALAIHPDTAMARLVSDIKLRLREEVGSAYTSENTPAQVTLFYFMASEKDYALIIAEFRRVAAGVKSFMLDFSGFDHFANSHTFYIKPEVEAAESILQMGKYINKHFRAHIKRKYIVHWKASLSRPHIPVGLKLGKDGLGKAYTLFTEFEQGFLCDSLVVRRLNRLEGRYEIIDTVPLLGHKYVSGQQMSLFS